MTVSAKLRDIASWIESRLRRRAGQPVTQDNLTGWADVVRGIATEVERETGKAGRAGSMRLEAVTVWGWAEEVQQIVGQVETKLRRAQEADDREAGTILREVLSAVQEGEASLRVLARDRREETRERQTAVENR